ncbi:unnamed protein product [Polarella glacialis]|uniref:Uncharacterized protein n=1 Tax=Polarella glacialis TaxID=89957 RepID=A0A813KUA7_POLGL|nr:unnamed protein product [Polarella glacialis]
MTEFSPYENCSIATQMSRSCANRRPCGQQPGYLGPFEHVNPGLPDGNESWCGAFLQPGGTSYYPERLLASVCEWQDRFPTTNWCRPQICATPESDQQCRLIEQFGLNNVPTGMIWNEAYPDDHTPKPTPTPTPTPPREDQLLSECLEELNTCGERLAESESRGILDRSPDRSTAGEQCVSILLQPEE